ncbi:hypothetical protein [Modestobacter sp. SYSU DS0290]
MTRTGLVAAIGEKRLSVPAVDRLVLGGDVTPDADTGRNGAGRCCGWCDRSAPTTSPSGPESTPLHGGPREREAPRRGGPLQLSPAAAAAHHRLLPAVADATPRSQPPPCTATPCRGSSATRQVAAARCEPCPVLDPCRSYTDVAGEGDQVWAGQDRTPTKRTVRAADLRPLELGLWVGLAPGETQDETLAAAY